MDKIQSTVGVCNISLIDSFTCFDSILPDGSHCDHVCYNMYTLGIERKLHVVLSLGLDLFGYLIDKTLGIQLHTLSSLLDNTKTPHNVRGSL